MLDPEMGLLETYSPYDYSLGVAMSRFSNTGFFLSLGIYDESIHIMNMLTNKVIAQLSIRNM